MQHWIWIDPEVLLAVHEEQLAEHGGAAGIRDKKLFESALARPQHVDAYGLPEGGKPTAADLSAFYLHGLACNHPFVDGNKRTALVAAELFLELNGFSLNASDEDCVLLTLSVAAGKNSEKETADWIRERIVKRPQ
jgi:death-on-curing protein